MVAVSSRLLRFLRWALAALVFGLPVAQVIAHSVGQVQTTKFFAPATVNMLKARALAGTAGFQVGDFVEYIIQFTPVANNASYGANGYVTDYVPPGTQVVQASFVTLSGYDGNGDPVFTDIAPPLPGMMSTGSGGLGTQTYVGTVFSNHINFDTTQRCAAATITAATCNGRLSELYADTGIFYSTDGRTTQNPALPSRVSQGTSGNGYTLAGVARASQLTGIIGSNVNTSHNLWDTCMARAFGGETTAGRCTPDDRVQTGGGVTPFLAGSAVAGPQTGYPLDYTGSVGPWQRIRYSGSRIGDPTLGPSRAKTQTGTAGDNGSNWSDTGSATISPGGLASNSGYALSTSNPLPAGTNAVRWAVGKLTVGQINYVKITLQITQPIGSAGVTNGSEVYGGDASDLTGTAASVASTLDSVWPYLVPSVADNNSNLYISKTLCQYDPTATTCTPLGGTTVAGSTTLTYQILYLNTGNADQTNVTLKDQLPCTVATSAVGMKIGSATGPFATVNPSVPFTTATTAGSSCGSGTQTRNTVTFPNLGTVGPGVGGKIIMNVVNTTSSAGSSTVNTGWLFSDQLPGGVYSNAVSFVGATTLNANPSLSISKVVNTTTVAAGGTAQFTIVVQNTGVSSVTTLTVADILPSSGSTVDPTTRFNYVSTPLVTSTGLTTATAMVISTATASSFTADSRLIPYNTGAYAANQVVPTWSFGSSTFAPGGVVTITFNVSVGGAVPASSTPYTNSARAILGNPSNVPLTYSIDATNVAGITVTSPLGITKTIVGYFNPASSSTFNPISTSGNIPANSRVRYNVAYANLLGATITSVGISDLLPCQIQASSGDVTLTASTGPIPAAFSNFTPTTGNCPNTRQTIQLGSPATLNAGASGSLTYDVILTTPATTSTVVSNAATITGTGVASATSQVDSSVVAVANLSISKVASQASVLPGGTLNYTITIVNTGTAPASTLTVYDWLPTGTSTTADSTRRFSLTGTAIVSGVTSTFASTVTNTPPTQTPYSGGTYAANQQELVFNFTPTTSIPIGGTLTIVIPTAVGSNLPTLAPPNYYYNNAKVTYNNGLSAASNAATANVSLYASLSVTKTDGTTTVLASKTTTYTLTFVNDGPSNAPNTTIRDTPGTGLSCTTVTCVATAGATCPAGLSSTPVALSSVPLTGTGTYIPTFNAGSTVTLAITCSVTATGQ